MSFEGVFKNWLKTQGSEESKIETRGSSHQQQKTCHAGEAERVDDEADHHQDALGTEPSKHASLSGGVNISSNQAGEKIWASSPFSVKISCSLGDAEDRHSRDQQGQKDRVNDCVDRTRECSHHSIVSKVNFEGLKQTMPAGQDHRQCHTHSPLTDLRDLTPTTSPSSAEIGRGHPVLSPEHDSPMEPDSTSECLLTSKSSLSKRKCEINMHKVYQGMGSSPCNTGKSNPGVKASSVTVNIEESQAECDSTCMFLASPHAISPASQGEIEERVCPFLTDHEDGASPAHCVCQCRSLPTANLLPRDHVPTITTATSASPPSLTSPHLTVKIISTKTDSSSSETSLKSPLISPKSHYECKTTSDLEHFVTKLELKRKKIDEKQLTGTVTANLQDKDFGKQCLTDYAKTDSTTSATVTKVKRTPQAVVKTPLDLSDLSTGESGTSRHERCSHSDELNVNPKCDTKQNEVCDFAKHIDWDTAVAETFESSTSVRGYNGESKPGIILKIRAKAVVPCLEKNLDPKSVRSASSAKRKGESLGSPEILSRLRKRQKSEPAPSETLSCFSEQASSEQYAGHCKVKSRGSRSGTDSGCSCCNTSTSQRRRNTVHIDGDLKIYTRHLSPSDCKFVESTTRLSRLQTLTFSLVCTLSPLFRQQLNHVTPESNHFTEIVDHIIGCLERSDSEESLKDFEHLIEQFEKLELKKADFVPVYSPQVVLCNDPGHSLEDFQHKVCRLLQLLLPDLTVSLSECFLQSPDHLERVVRQVLEANKIKDKSARKCRLFSL